MRVFGLSKHFRIEQRWDLRLLILVNGISGTTEEARHTTTEVTNTLDISKLIY